MLRLVFGRRNVGRVIHRLEQVKERKNENPNQINKVPEQPRHLNSIREMLRILAIQFRPDRQPEINEDDHPAQDVQAVQPGDRKVSREIGAVRRQKHRRAVHIGLVDARDLFRRRHIKEMRSIHLRVGRIGVDRVERDFVFLDLGVVQRLVIVEMPGDLNPRRQTFAKADACSREKLRISPAHSA